MQFTRDDIKRYFDAGTFSRGEDYHRSGMVQLVQWECGLLQGEVKGSGRNHYYSVTSVEQGRKGPDFDGDCTCPVGSNCKHVVAVLLASLQRGITAPAPTVRKAAALGSEAAKWLEHLSALLDEARSPPPRDPAARLHCVLTPGRRPGKVSVKLCRARPGKGGNAGMTVYKDAYALLSGYLPPAEEELVRVVAALNSGVYYNEDNELAGRMGARVLALAGELGRLYWAGSIGDLKRGAFEAIAPGPERKVALAWRAPREGADVLGLAWQFDDGTAVERVLPTDPPCYLHALQLGAAVLPAELAALRPDGLRLLVDTAPLLGMRERAAMAARLTQRGLERVLPPPETVETRTRGDIVPTPHLLLDCWVSSNISLSQHQDFIRLWFDYDGLSTKDNRAELMRRASDGVIELIERDEAAEASALEFLTGMGFTIPRAWTPVKDIDGAMELTEPELWMAFVRHAVPRM
jgi:hypothetical protein